MREQMREAEREKVGEGEKVGERVGQPRPILQKLKVFGQKLVPWQRQKFVRILQCLPSINKPLMN